MKLSELEYQRDSSLLFEQVADEPWSMFIDSGYPRIDMGRYDIIVASPEVTLSTFGDITHIKSQAAEAFTSTDDPFLLVKQYLGESESNLSGLPFCGGALGYFSYDLGRRIELMPNTANHDITLPDMAIGIYDWAVIVDHHQRRSWLTSFCRYESTSAKWQELESLFQNKTINKKRDYSITTSINSNMTKADYIDAFNKVKHYICEGDCYQVNLAQRFQVGLEGDSWQVYQSLRQFNPAPYASYINLPEGAVISSSPERFLRVTGNQVETKPIKGTVHRSAFAYEDKALAETLMESEKDRAENLMIVDLLRNDISKTCKSGSVTVPKLFALETYATVHHLVSTVKGKLADDMHAVDLLRGCFPGGSITGAPKLRSMEIIEELEPHRRSIYCGSIAYIGFDGNMDSNICIRTLIREEEWMYFYAGGGIVWDSDADKEYQECFDKAAGIIKLCQNAKQTATIN
ncbi:MAG: aminodeoxychorismate synthase component I [Pseudomonadota bacterium]